MPNYAPFCQNELMNKPNKNLLKMRGHSLDVVAFWVNIICVIYQYIQNTYIARYYGSLSLFGVIIFASRIFCVFDYNDYGASSS